eukprot:tig00001501_g9219.t1
MSLTCALSGGIPEEPVISKKSGHAYEKRLIEKYLEANGTCPITKEPMSKEDLLVPQASKIVKPRPPNATSIPSLLAIFQNEWDALTLETFTLKQHLDTVRQELSHALYQHDAACRVIARLVKERDQARNALAAATAQLSQIGAQGAAAPSAAAEPMEVDVPKPKSGLTSDVVKKMTSTATALSKGRKKRQASASLATPEQIQAYKQVGTSLMHKASPPGVTCLDINPRDANMAVSGGVDGDVILFNRAAGKLVAKLAGHSKKVTDVLVHPSENVIFSSSTDKTVKVWTGKDSSWKAALTLKEHAEEVVGVSLHATGDYLVSASHDGTWAIFDIRSGFCFVQTQDAGITRGDGRGSVASCRLVGSGAIGPSNIPWYSSVAFHPDGLILGTATPDALIKVWDVKSQANVATFEGHAGPVSSIAFSENGFYLASASHDGTVKLWDLRKAGQPDACNFKTLSVSEGTPINAVAFDYSGQYLAAAGANVRVFATKGFEEVKAFGEHTAAVTDVAFGPDAAFIGSASLDRSVKFFAAA